jgi:hypothetical protein
VSTHHDPKDELTVNSTQEKQRRLNMEEKRHLQKLIFHDIDAAAKSYRAARNEARQKLQQRLIEHAPPKVAALVAEFTRASDNIARIEKELSDLGSGLSGYPERTLHIAYGKPPQAILEFDAETRRRDKSMSDLKRDYTLRLFAGGEEAQELFATLARELTKIVS